MSLLIRRDFFFGYLLSMQISRFVSNGYLNGSHRLLGNFSRIESPQSRGVGGRRSRQRALARAAQGAPPGFGEWGGGPAALTQPLRATRASATAPPGFGAALVPSSSGAFAGGGSAAAAADGGDTRPPQPVASSVCSDAQQVQERTLVRDGSLSTRRC